ncbi:MAG: prepilin peptidase [Roseovarius sp.]
MAAEPWFDPVLPVLLVLLGAPMGSFAALLAQRLPRGAPVLITRSRCDACGQALRWWELLPLLSFLALRGRCARCGAAIPPRLLQAELAGLALGALAAWAGAGLIGALALWCLLALTLSDLGSFRLPNPLTFALLLLALAVAAWPPGKGLSPELESLSHAALGAALGAGVFLAISIAYKALRGRPGMGEGDIRLMAGIGALILPAAGWQGLFMVTLIAGLSGIALGLLRALRRGRSLRARMRVPFGACLAMAASAVYLAALVLPRL